MEAMRNVRGVSATGSGEGDLTKMIESQTSRIPSGAFLTIAVGAMAVSAFMMLLGKRNVANFVGQWAPTILIMGLYNKLVKVKGSE